jgi:hypothetical protein
MWISVMHTFSKFVLFDGVHLVGLVFIYCSYKSVTADVGRFDRVGFNPASYSG